MKALLRNKFYLSGLLALLMISCGDRTEKPSGEADKEMNDISYHLQYCSRESMKAQGSGVDPADLYYFKLVISEAKNNGQIAALYNQGNYNKLLYYINKNIQDDFNLVKGDKEESPVQVYFESNNRLAKRLIFMLAFEKPPVNDGDVVVEFNDNIFNNGKIKFRYDSNELN